MGEDLATPICVYLASSHETWPPPSLYFQAFSRGTWLVLVVFLLTITVAIAFTLHIETRYLHFSIFDNDLQLSPLSREPMEPSQDPASEEQEHWEVSEFFLVTIGAICQQGTWRHPQTVAARILFLTLFLLAVFFYTAFSAAVTSLLSSDRSTRYDSRAHLSLEAILGLPGAALTLQDTPYFHRVMLSPRRPRFMSLRWGVVALFSGTATVLCADSSDLQGQLGQLGQEIRCRLHRTPFTLTLAPEKYQFNATSSRQDLRLRESGLRARELHRRRSELWAGEGDTGEDPGCGGGREGAGGVISVALEDVWPALAVLSCGLFIATFLIAAESVYSWGDHQLQRQRQRQRERLKNRQRAIQRAEAQLKVATGERAVDVQNMAVRGCMRARTRRAIAPSRASCGAGRGGAGPSPAVAAAAAAPSTDIVPPTPYRFLN